MVPSNRGNDIEVPEVPPPAPVEPELPPSPPVEPELPPNRGFPSPGQMPVPEKAPPRSDAVPTAE
jgi:hypothetical protein